MKLQLFLFIGGSCGIIFVLNPTSPFESEFRFSLGKFPSGKPLSRKGVGCFSLDSYFAHMGFLAIHLSFHNFSGAALFLLCHVLFLVFCSGITLFKLGVRQNPLSQFQPEFFLFLNSGKDKLCVVIVAIVALMIKLFVVEDWGKDWFTSLNFQIGLIFLWKHIFHYLDLK